MRSVVRFNPAKVVCSRGVQRASGLARNDSGPSNMSLLSVVSMWKIGTAASTISPWRPALLCSSDFEGSMNDFEWRIVWTLWCALTLLYVPRPTATDLWPPSIVTMLMFTYTSRSDSAARLESSTASPWRVSPRSTISDGSSASWLYRRSG